MSTVQARLDTQTSKCLNELTAQLGWSPSKVVREGIKLVAASQPSRRKARIIGLGKFSSGLKDLASNKKHLEGFGR